MGYPYNEPKGGFILRRDSGDVSGPETTKPPIRTFATGATRDTDHTKIDYEGFLSPLALREFGKYMTKHRQMKDGSLRDSDNWQRGIPIAEYMKSMFRHFVDVHTLHRGHEADVDIKEALCAVIFNAQGYLHELLNAEEGNKCER